MDLQGYITLLNRNTGELLDLVRDVDEAALNHKSFNSWSILEVLEHLLLTERFVCEILERPAEKQAETKELKGGEKLERLLVGLRARKVKAPEILEPAGALSDQKEFATQFLQLRTSLAEALEQKRVIIDQRVYSHPLLGEMTMSDWLHFLVSHARRHMEQMRDVLEALEKKDRTS